MTLGAVFLPFLKLLLAEEPTVAQLSPVQWHSSHSSGLHQEVPTVALCMASYWGNSIRRGVSVPWELKAFHFSLGITKVLARHLFWGWQKLLSCAMPLTGIPPSSNPTSLHWPHVHLGPARPALEQETVPIHCILFSPHCPLSQAACVGLGDSSLQKMLRQDGMPALQGMCAGSGGGGPQEDVLPSTRTSSSGNPHLHPLCSGCWPGFGSPRLLAWSLGGCWCGGRNLTLELAPSLPGTSLPGSRTYAQTPGMKDGAQAGLGLITSVRWPCISSLTLFQREGQGQTVWFPPLKSSWTRS